MLKDNIHNVSYQNHINFPKQWKIHVYMHSENSVKACAYILWKFGIGVGARNLCKFFFCFTSTGVAIATEIATGLPSHVQQPRRNYWGCLNLSWATFLWHISTYFFSLWGGSLVGSHCGITITSSSVVELLLVFFFFFFSFSYDVIKIILVNVILGGVEFVAPHSSLISLL